MKKSNLGSKRFIIVAVLVVIALLVSWSFYFSNQKYNPVDPLDTSYLDIIIADNSNAQEVAAILKKNDLIHTETAFLSYVRKNDFDNKLRAGHYKLSRSQSLQEIVDSIVSGRVVNISFTVPEGFTVKQIGNMLVEKGITTEAEWNDAINQEYNYNFLREIPSGQQQHLEGFLFPDTYFISENTNAQEIVKLMLNSFENVWQKEFAGQAENGGMNLLEIITLASLIEKEAKIEKERKTISGVIINRLEKGMLLRIDATVLYCLGEHKNVVTYDDLEVDSIYNTYKYPGLPPGPIASPGRASINAALNPEMHPYFYYCSKGDGSHYFAKTYEEHKRAKNKYIN